MQRTLHAGVLILAVCLALLLAGCGAPSLALGPGATPEPVLTPPASPSSSAPLPPPQVPVPASSVTPQMSYLATFGLRIFGGQEGTHGLISTDGTNVYWVDGLDRPRVTRVSDGRELFPDSKPITDSLVAVSNRYAIWQVPEPWANCPPDCPAHLALRDLQTGAVMRLATGYYSEVFAAISGDWLVWIGEDRFPNPPVTRPVPGPPEGNIVVTSSLTARNLRTGAPPVVLQRTTNPITFKIAGDGRVIWGEQTGADAKQLPTGTIYAEPIGGGPVQTLVSGTEASPYEYDLNGELLTYTTPSQESFWAVNLRTGWRREFQNAGMPTTDGRYIFWVDREQEKSSPKHRIDLWGYDTAADVTFPVAINVGVNSFPVARGGVLAWLHHEDSPSFHSHPYALVLSEMQPGPTGP